MTLTLPPPPARAVRSAMPLFAALVPVLGGVGIWLFTGSVYALWFAALGPLIAVAALVDGVIGGRRRARRDARERATALDALESEVEGALTRACARAWSDHPDVLRLVRSDSGVWRPDDDLVVGVGSRASGITLSGSAGDDERATRLVRRAARMTDGPVTAPWRSGICVTGDGVEPPAALRALVAQLCLRVPPTLVRIVGELPPGWEWVQNLPHRHSRSATAVRVALRTDQPAPAEADTVFALARAGEPLDPRAATVLRLGVERAVVTVAGSAAEQTLSEVEALSRSQAAVVAEALAARATAVYDHVIATTDATGFELWDAAHSASGGLAAAFAVEGGRPVVLDLVADGPHAVVVGVTGSGKSELLTSWITALCAAHPTSAVSFLLADFKGGTAFDALAALPHVTGVITDLDGQTAVRAISSLRAEVRHREGVLAAAGARDIDDPRVDMPRLVVVVDEYAALVGDHLELAHVFADVAARGRALGIHLILGTQRATGVIRDAVLGNAPLRIALRVTDAADARLVMGSDDAARLPGGPDDRGRALIRRAADLEPVRARIIRTAIDEIAQVAARRETDAPPRRPWLPPLPAQLALDEARGAESSSGPGIVLGVLDEPDHQRRRRWTFGTPHDRSLLVLGSGGSGRSTLLEVAASQVRGAVWVPADPEQGWDVLDELARGRRHGSLVLLDDLDALLSGLGDEYALTAAARVEGILRAGSTDVIASTRRLSGPLLRIADLFGRRCILAQPSKTEFAQAGADAAAYIPRLPPGRAWTQGLYAQVALPPGGPSDTARAAQDARWKESQRWTPGPLTAVVTRSAPAVSAACAAAGTRVLTLASVPPTVRALDELGGGRRSLVVVGEPEAWQQRWSLLTDARDRYAVLVDAACPVELRMITGERELPPYARPRTGRGWLLERGAAPRRIRLPEHDG